MQQSPMQKKEVIAVLRASRNSWADRRVKEFSFGQNILFLRIMNKDLKTEHLNFIILKTMIGIYTRAAGGSV
jgi:co-chaperonin GroES (HSP10)